jgi:hypothetical protein
MVQSFGVLHDSARGQSFAYNACRDLPPGNDMAPGLVQRQSATFSWRPIQSAAGAFQTPTARRLALPASLSTLTLYTLRVLAMISTGGLIRSL